MSIRGWFGALTHRMKELLGIGNNDVESSPAPPPIKFRLPGRRLLLPGSHERKRRVLQAKRRGTTPKKGRGRRPHRRGYLAGSGTFGGATEIRWTLMLKKRIREALKKAA